MGFFDRIDDRGFNLYVENKNNIYLYIIFEFENF